MPLDEARASVSGRSVPSDPQNLRRQRHEDALVAIHVGPSLVLRQGAPDVGKILSAT
jgi:hypothetical protein